MIKVSIIIPVYNVEQYLERCLESVVEQTLKDIEIIIVNDGSKDKSQEIIDNYKEKYNYIKCYIKDNGGLSDARNYGMANATGEYILFLDSDDYLKKDACENLYNISKKNNLDILKFNYFDEKKNKDAFVKDKKYMNKIYNGKNYLKEVLDKDTLSIVAWNALYSREYIEKNNFQFKKGILHEDERWTPEVILKCKKIMHIRNVYYFYKLNPSSITTRKDKTKNAIDIIDTCEELFEIYKDIEDKKLKRLLMDMLVTKYLEAFVMGALKEQVRVDKRFLIGKSLKIRNKLKVILFIINKKLYYKLNVLKNMEEK